MKVNEYFEIFAKKVNIWTNDLIKEFAVTFKTYKEEKVEPIPILIGTLNKQIGFVGYQLAEIGHPVYEFNDRYLITLMSLDGKKEHTVRYYKETLKDSIDYGESN